MDISFVLLVFAFASIFVGHVTKVGIWKLLAVPAFLYLAIDNSEHILIAVGFAMACIVVLFDIFFRGE